MKVRIERTERPLRASAGALAPRADETRRPLASTLRLAGRDPDIVVFSHLRWDFVFQRPQHLFTRFARRQRVFFVEEPLRVRIAEPALEVSARPEGVAVVVPRIPQEMGQDEVPRILRGLLDRLIKLNVSSDWIAWYYTPMALAFTRHLTPSVVVYDCMDELSAFKGAPPRLQQRERELFLRADVVFTGGHSLYRAKRRLHRNIHPMPSSIDREHFARARAPAADAADQSQIPHPRVGFFGVLDERFDRELLAAVAATRPDWHFILVGPTAKIELQDFPTGPNLHYLGAKPYAELPAYLGQWDAAILPFALNESTRFISPTKTPEYLAGGKPVVSTPILDVVRPYGELDLVNIARTPEEFITGVERAFTQARDEAWLRRVDAFLKTGSWERTWQRADELVRASWETREATRELKARNEAERFSTDSSPYAQPAG